MGAPPKPLDFCGRHGITSDAEVITMQQVNTAWERLQKADVKYRFVIDLASLKQPAPTGPRQAASASAQPPTPRRPRAATAASRR